MPYNQFSFKRVREEFGLTVRDARLYDAVTPHPLTEFFLNYFDHTRRHAFAVNTEKAKSEWIIAPLLLEAKLIAGNDIRLFSGVSLDLDASCGLNGVCDFIFSRGMSQYVLTAPIVTIVEAKNDNVGDGIGQCIAEMVAARDFNLKDREGLPGIVVHGLVTTGSSWKFMQLQDHVVTMDTEEYVAQDPEKIVGILLHILAQSAPSLKSVP